MSVAVESSTSPLLLPPSSIQRILIFHLTLPERCMCGLGEGASIQELSEQILYYHRDQKWSLDFDSKQPSSPRTKLSLTEEAVQFLGLCSALYGLPSSFFGDPEELPGEQQTKQIFFEKSTLVFMTLESSADLLAVAQIPRLYQQGTKAENGGGNPLAIRTSMERCHQLFCLLRGGGILNRLEPSLNTMGKLYRILKEIRKEKEQASKSMGTCKIEGNGLNSEVKIVDLQNEVTALRKKLPIQSVRRDLDVHYKEYLAHQGLAVARHGGACRCLVETIPEPIARACGTHAIESSSSNLSSFSILSLGLSTRRLLDDFIVGSDQDISLFGVSTFVDGQHLHSHWSDVSLSERMQEGRGGSPTSISVSNRMIHLVKRYMASYRVRMSQLPSLNQESASTSSHLGIRKIAMSFGGPPLAFASSSEASEEPNHPSRIMSKFVPPPPRFMLSATEEVDSIEIPSQQTKAWALKVCIPIQFGQCIKPIQFQMAVVMCEVENFSFLLFVDDHNCNHPSDGLSIVESRLTDMVLAAEENDRDADFLSQHETSSLQWTEPGQDVVIVNREQNKLFLFSDRKKAARKVRTKSATAESSTRRFLGFRAKSNFPDTEDSRSAHHLEWATLGLDCRHLLASHLHLDTILAFDDMMNEIALRRESVERRQKEIETRDFADNPARCEIVEFCTCMPLGWVYAWAAEEMEIYAFFDSSIYVTVADVQGAATRIQDHFFARRNTES